MQRYSFIGFNALALSEFMLIIHALIRGVAQPGSALAWGASGRRFKSFRPDFVTFTLPPRFDCLLLHSRLQGFDYALITSRDQFFRIGPCKNTIVLELRAYQ